MPRIARDAVIHVAGHRGLAGSAVWRLLEVEGFTNLIGATSAELDLRDRPAVQAFYAKHRPEYVVLAAARVGGIMPNSTIPATFISDNLQVQVNVLDAAAQTGVRKLLFLGSSCAYPRLAPQPITEDALLTGPVEETNAAYAVAKIAGIEQVRALRQELGLPYISAMPTNLYGPGDNFDLTNAHVLPALIRRFHEAKTGGSDQVTLWGTGTPRREFLHCDDFARACLVLLEEYDDPLPINVGVGEDLPIAELADLVAAVVGWSGQITWDPTKPDGTPRKLLDVSRINALGWRAQIPLRDGIAATYRWFRESPQTRGVPLR